MESPLFPVWKNQEEAHMMFSRYGPVTYDDLFGNKVDTIGFQPFKIEKCVTDDFYHYTSIPEIENKLIALAPVWYEPLYHDKLGVLPFALRRQAMMVSMANHRSYANGILMNQKMFRMLTAIENMLPLKPNEPESVGRWIVGGTLNKWGDSGSLVFINDCIPDNEAVVFFNGDQSYASTMGVGRKFDTSVAAVEDGGYYKLALPMENMNNELTYIACRYFFKVVFYDHTFFWGLDDETIAAGLALKRIPAGDRGYRLNANNRILNLFVTDKEIGALAELWDANDRDRPKCFAAHTRPIINGNP